MKDSRVTLWTNPTAHLTGTTTNTGPTIDLWGGASIDGGVPDGTDAENGIGYQIIQTSNSGTGQATTWTFDESADASTWYAGGTVAVLTMTTSSIVKKAKGSIRTRRRYIRFVAANTGTGASTSVVYPEDATYLQRNIAIA